MNILFVCTGNTCRSPLAEAFCRQRAGMAATDVRSAGLFAVVPSPASEGARYAAAALGASLDAHSAHAVTEDLMGWADAVYVMTRAHLAQLQARFPSYARKMKTLSSQDIPDPFGGEQAVYHACAVQIHAAVQALPLSAGEDDGL